jgi:uncharacterized protein YeaO (DUF488 family)
MSVRLKRVYDPPSPDDGARILVDRLWPRGMTKEAAAVDEWLRDAAPSTMLRKWFAHDPRRWRGFEQRYFRELNGNPEVVARLRKLMAGKRLTLVYGARDPHMNNAVALKHYLEHSLSRETEGGTRS